MAKSFEEECKEGRFEFKSDRSFEERCDEVYRYLISLTYRFGHRIEIV